MSKTDIWMPLYIADYLADTQHLTRDEHGAYLLLMMAYWRAGAPLADDDKRLAAICKCSPKEWKELRPTIEEFFSVADGLWNHKRIDEELAEAAANAVKYSDRARKAAEKRWGKQSPGDATSNASSNASSTANGMPEQCTTPSPSPVSLSETTTTANLGASSSPSPADQIAQMLAKLEGGRGIKGARFKPGDKRIAQWVQAGLALDRIQAAYEAAVQRRIADGDPSAVNTGLIDSILAGWVNEPGSSVVPKAAKPWYETQSGVDAKAKELGMKPYHPDHYGTWQQFRVCVINKSEETVAA